MTAKLTYNQVLYLKQMRDNILSDVRKAEQMDEHAQDIAAAESNTLFEVFCLLGLDWYEEDEETKRKKYREKLGLVHENAAKIHNESGMQKMWEYLHDLSGIKEITETDADLIGEEIMIYGG